MAANDELGERLARVEERLAALESAPPAAAAFQAESIGFDPTVFYALQGLKAQAPETGGVVFAGFLGGEAGDVNWQYGATYDDLAAQDWAEQSARLEALASPVRLTILRSVHAGIDTVIRLAELSALGSSGQIYHHINLLIAAGWLTQARRGHYVIPVDRLVPLLVILTASKGL
jgi:hypothetical protein